MSLLPEKTFIAIEAVLFIACQTGGEAVPSREICSHQGLTLRYLEQLLQAMVRAGILKSSRGSKGGYTLARDRRHIPLAEIHELVLALDRRAGECGKESALHATAIVPLKEEIDGKIRSALNSRTLHDLCELVQRSGSRAIKGKKADFAI